MPAARDQPAHAAKLDAELAGIIERARAIAGRASDGALHARPVGGGWTVGEIFQHLVISTGDYLEMIRPRLADHGPSGKESESLAETAPPGQGAGAPDGGRSAGVRQATESVAARWQPTLMGGLLVRSLRSPRRLPAPRRWRGVATPRSHVVDRFLEQITEARRLLASSQSVEWRRLRYRSPITRLLRLDLGDVFTIITAHATRHLRQAERTLGEVGGAASDGAVGEARRGGSAVAGDEATRSPG